MFLRTDDRPHLTGTSTVSHMDKEKTSKELVQIINIYKESGFDIFIEFAGTLERFKEPIIASFHYYTLSTGEIKRLSNGPLEGYNRTPKDMGFEVFEYIRARLIFCSRKDCPIKGIPKSKEEIKRSGRKYRKNRNKKDKKK